jgi:hypothetical protein
MCCNRSSEAIAAFKMFNSCRNSASTLQASMSVGWILSGEMETDQTSASPHHTAP